MCMVSVILDHYNDKWKPERWYPRPYTNPPPISPFTPNITREEFDSLRKEVLDMKELVKKAKVYDEQTNQPDCEKPDKVAILRKIAEAVGVKLDDVLGSGVQTATDSPRKQELCGETETLNKDEKMEQFE